MFSKRKSTRARTVKRTKAFKQPDNLDATLRNRCVILFVILIIVGFGYIYRSGQANSSAYRLNDLKRKVVALEAENTHLHLEIAYLKSPERIQSIAVKELGMVLPDKFFFSTKKD